MMVGSTLCITGRVQPGRYDPTRVQLSIGDIQYLSDVKDDLIQKITIHLNADKLTDDVVISLKEALAREEGNVSVEFIFHNSEGHSLTMKPKDLKIKVTRPLLDYLRETDGLDYNIN